jgi:catechol 2,3-dioxygenase-like lactoylglutathione lyase family enzyme
LVVAGHFSTLGVAPSQDRSFNQPQIIMPAQAIHHINIRAHKTLVAELKDFYEGVLGLRAGWRPPFKSTGHWLYLEDRPVVHLVEDETVQGSTGSRGPIVDHVALSCTGLRDFEELLRTKNIAFRRTEVPETSLVQLIFVDPAGNGVELQFADGDA